MEKERMDLVKLKEKLVSKKSCAGGYIVSFNAFIRIYEFIHRMVIRNPRNVSIALLHIEIEDGPDREKRLEEDCKALEKTMCKVLRREDVAARCSETQYAMILMNADDEQGRNVIDRILEVCRKLNNAMSFDVTYDIYNLDTRQEVEDELGTEYGQRFREKCCIYNNQWISFCLENHHIDAEKYEVNGKTLINRMCLHCGYKWTVQHEDNEAQIRKVWSEGKWWNHTLE